MRIGIVGGMDRSAPQVRRLAAQAGVDIELHTGVTAGRGSPELESLVRRCDLIVVVTALNSHGGVRLARQLARQYGRQVILANHWGISKLSQLLDSLRDQRPVAA